MIESEEVRKRRTVRGDEEIVEVAITNAEDVSNDRVSSAASNEVLHDVGFEVVRVEGIRIVLGVDEVAGWRERERKRKKEGRKCGYIYSMCVCSGKEEEEKEYKLWKVTVFINERID